ncbi:RNA-binding domain-containing protein [Kroppenstedtia eburnea]|uniref:ATP-dependent DNA helicase RecG n=1 Tax=Kroppenstedtia eburnea TaxID=714067 RepID=A0A1N7LM49_9BACL|nr:RNA-binding domain-containing protein [Kroppenstedtia eburnea]QKI81263.1 ATP-dependent DNA helicase RecG [Kroppenstedtia eburnea]SIS74864.1 ATP-dependent DNA helicase RecG [Kroppenstedtia eburnea]
MGFEVNEISAMQKKRILSSDEGHFVDFKSKNIKPAKLTKTISAFANSMGGELYIGIEDDRSWKGFKDPEEANGFIQIFEELFPFGEYFTYEFLSNRKEMGYVLHVNVLKTNEVMKASDGNPYIRRGAQSLAVKTVEAQKRLEFDKGVSSFESQTLDMDVDVLVESEVLERFINDVLPTETRAEAWLKKQILIKKGKPTVAGALLFAEEPQALLPKRCGIKIYRYKTKDEKGTRDTLAFNPLTIEGCLYDQIYGAVKRTTEIVEEIKKLGKEGLEPITYPEETLHEIITNAVIHRDYSLASDIHVRVFDNRIEVESPGKLPGHVTPDNILNEQLARNGTIVRLINKFPNPPNKDVGEGLNTAFEAMNKLRLKEPIIEETRNSVIVYIRHESLASPEEIILDYLETHEEISNRVVRELTGIGSENKVKSTFYALRDRGLLERTPGKQGSASTWRKLKS